MAFSERPFIRTFAQTMPSSSQSGFNQKPNPSQPRRLQTPEERFGHHRGEAEAIEALPEVPDPFAPLPPVSSSSKKRAKARHERQRFDRDAQHIEPRRAKRQMTKAQAAHVPVAHIAPQTTPSAAKAPIGENATDKAKREHESETLKRIRARRKRAWKRAIGVLALIIVAGTGVAALSAPQMEIEQVHISGLHATSPVLVKPIAARLLGQNAIRANKGAVEQSVERLPTVASARVVVRPELPPRAELQVVERKPVMRVGRDGVWWVADEAGNPYRTANARDAQLPALTWDTPIQTLKPLDARRWSDAMQLAEAVEENLGQKGMATLADIRSMQLDAVGDATLVLAGTSGAPDLTLKLGNDQWAEKLAKARTARLYFARTNRKAVELNLISLDSVRWTPLGATVASSQSGMVATPAPAT